MLSTLNGRPRLIDEWCEIAVVDLSTRSWQLVRARIPRKIPLTQDLLD